VVIGAGRRRRLVAWTLVALAAGAARSAAAQDRDTRALEAKKACLGGHPDRGIELLADLYAETNDPTYIYNQGRCFEQNGRAGEAVTRFREYLRKAPGLPPDEKTQLSARIDELEAQARAASPGTAPAATAPAPAQAPGATAPASTAPGIALTAPAPGSARSYQLAGVVVGGVGVLAVAGGVVMGLRARSLSSQVTSDAFMKGTFSQSDYDAGRLAERLEWAGYGLGAAALVTGGFLYYWGVRQSGREPAATVTASADAKGARACLRVSF
jgi:hypothetical protein